MLGHIATALRRTWETSSPTAKRTWVVGTVLVLVVGGASLIIVLSPKGTRSRISKEVETTVMLPRRRDLSAEQLASELTALERRVATIEGATRSTELAVRESAAQVTNRINELGSTKLVEDRIAQIVSNKLDEQRHKALEKESSAPKADASNSVESSIGHGFPSLSTPLPPVRQEAPTTGPETVKSAKPALRVIGAADAARQISAAGLSAQASTLKGSSNSSSPGLSPTSSLAAAKGVLTQPSGVAATTPPNLTARDRVDGPSILAHASTGQTWLPAGAMLGGVLLNGMDAPTSTVAQKNPTPALIRIKHDAILPNRYSADIKECFVLVSGYGVMSTERANLRTETVSCVRRDGGVLETRVDGYVISAEDGKVGLRGRLVSKQGAVLARSMIAGFFSGIGRALQPQSIVGINTNPTGTIETQQADAASVMENGAYAGASNALTSVAKFYLDMAKEMFPVVEIDAGREAVIVLVHGTALKLQR